MADTTLEVFKTIGALSGLFATAFLLRDRYTKYFPIAIIVARPLMAGSKNIQYSLRVKNVSERPILVSWNSSDQAPTQLLIAKNSSPRGMMEPLILDETVIALGPEQEVFLPLMKPNRYDDIDGDNILEAFLWWQFAQRTSWNVTRKIRVCIRKHDFDSMANHYVDPDKER